MAPISVFMDLDLFYNHFFIVFFTLHTPQSPLLLSVSASSLYVWNQTVLDSLHRGALLLQWATHTLTGWRSETNLRTAAAPSSPRGRGSGGSCQTNAVMCKANLPIQPPESSAGRQRWHNWAGYYKYFFFLFAVVVAHRYGVQISQPIFFPPHCAV